MMSLQGGKGGGDDVTHKKNSWQNGTAILQFFQQRLIKKNKKKLPKQKRHKGQGLYIYTITIYNLL